MPDPNTPSKRMKFSSKSYFLQPPSYIDTNSQMNIDPPEENYTPSRIINRGVQSKKQIPQKVLDQISSYKNDVFLKEKGYNCRPCCKCDDGSC